MKRVLVTGGLGFIGSNLVKRLVRDGYKVEVVDDLSNGTLDSIKELNVRSVPLALLSHYLKSQREECDVLCIHGDFADIQVLSRIAEKKYDVVFHLAAVPRVEYSVENPAITTDINVMRTVSLMTACVQNVEKFVFSSSSAIYGNVENNYPSVESGNSAPTSPYGLQKEVIEKYCKLYFDLYDLDSVCLRYFNVYGPGQMGDSPYSTAVSAWMDKIKKSLPLRSDGDGEQTRDMVYVDDVVQANMLCALSTNKLRGEIINVGTGNSISNKDILDLLSKRFKFSVNKAPERKGDVKHTKANISKAESLLGFKAETSFEDGLEKTINWWNLNEKQPEI